MRLRELQRSASLNVIDGEVQVSTLSAGTSFGEMALTSDSRSRRASIVTVEVRARRRRGRRAIEPRRAHTRMRARTHSRASC